MSDLVVTGSPLGRWQTNCFLIGDRERGTAAVIDPGEDGARAVPELLELHGLTCEAILLTHGHLDHLWAVPDLARDLDVPVFLHADDRWLWDDPGAGFGHFPAGALEQAFGVVWRPPTERVEDLHDGQRLRVGGVELVVHHTPGHTPGHVTFLVTGVGSAELEFGRADRTPDAGVLFSGDLVFAGSVGRTDFPRGSMTQQLDSIERTVLTLQDDVLVLPGHGPETTVGRERRTNPFLRELTHER